MVKRKVAAGKKPAYMIWLADIMYIDCCYTYLRYTKKEATSEQTVVAADHTHEGHDSTPAKHEDSHPVRRPHLLQDDIARHFEERVRDEKNRNSCVILECIGRHFQIRRHARNLCITDLMKSANCLSSGD